MTGMRFMPALVGAALCAVLAIVGISPFVEPLALKVVVLVFSIGGFIWFWRADARREKRDEEATNEANDARVGELASLAETGRFELAVKGSSHFFLYAGALLIGAFVAALGWTMPKTLFIVVGLLMAALGLAGLLMPFSD